MIGVGLVGFITIVAASASTSIRGTVDKGFLGDLVVQSNAGIGGGLPPEVATEIAALSETSVAAAVRLGPAAVDGSGTLLYAIDAASFVQIGDLEVTEGDLTDLDEVGTIAVAGSTADDKGVGIGDTLVVTYPATGPQELRVVALYDQADILGPYATGLATFGPNNDVQLDSFVYIKLAPGVALDEGRAAVAVVSDAYPNADLQDKTEFADSIVGQIDQLLNLVYVLLLLAVVIALIGIANTLALSIFERTRELGLLRAVGMTRRQLRSVGAMGVGHHRRHGHGAGPGDRGVLRLGARRVAAQRGLHRTHDPGRSSSSWSSFWPRRPAWSPPCPRRVGRRALDVLAAISSE